MKRTTSAVAASILAAALAWSATLWAAPPTPVDPVLTYQGSVFVDDRPFEGTGRFKLVIVDGAGTSLWSNDGTSLDGAEPTGSVAVPVDEGIFQVLLGSASIPGMQVIDPAIFNTTSVLTLKSWFNDGVSGFAELTPPIRITASVYSLNTQYFRGYEPIDFFLQTDQIISSQIAPGAVDNAAIATGAVGGAQIAAGSVTPDKITAFSNANNNFTIGSGAAATNVIYANQGAANNPGLRFDDATVKWQYSNDGTTWNDIGGGGGGGVNPGLINELAYYAAAGSTVSGLSTAANGVLATSGAGVPSIASALPAAVQGNITALGTVASGVWNGTAILDAYIADALTISGGTVNNSAIGATTASTGTFTDLVSQNDTAVQGGDVTIGQGTVAYAGRVVLHDADAGDSFTTTLMSAADVGASWSLILPAADGTAGQALTTNAGGQLGWSDVGSGDFKADGTVAMTGDLNVGDFNIINVGDIALDSISADDGSSFSMGSNWTNAGRTVADLGTVTTADINGGTMDGVNIGLVTAGDGTFDDLVATTFLLGASNQGDILYDNGTSIVRLVPGASGQFLQTQGAGANPQWAAAGTGDVVGPAGATDNAITRFDTATGKLIQNS
ncbi:MAG: hypothetical protein JXA24_04005, partial [Proteobacteria bacterium]|nr:hypothetical protein [Pseudomonadota bacterium]